MRYADGQSLKIGDRVELPNDASGVVVAVLDTNEYSTAYPEAKWGYLRTGFLARFDSFGLIHYTASEPDLKLLRRGLIRSD